MSETHTATLISILAMATTALPVRKSSTVSKLKVENVENPPQKPTTINIRSVGLFPTLSVKKPTANASTMQLMMFESSVASGNTDLNC